jgi:sugar fermentation stimulation protein A
MLFVIQRSDVEIFTPAFDIDPSYAQKLKNAYLNGVEISPLQVKVSPIATLCAR